MVKEFVDAYMRNKSTMRAHFAARQPDTYRDVVHEIVECINDYRKPEAYSAKPMPDPDRIHQIDDGKYQGTLVFVIGECGYQPSEYWYARIEYGSCCICDALMATEWITEPTKQNLDDLMTLALHVVQQLRPMQ